MNQTYKEELPPEPAVPAPNERTGEILAGVLRWVMYSVLMLVLLVPFLRGWQLATGCLLLGHFSAQVNKLIVTIKHKP